MPYVTKSTKPRNYNDNFNRLINILNNTEYVTNYVKHCVNIEVLHNHVSKIHVCRHVDFVTEEGVAKCGTLRLDLDDHQWELESTPSRPVSQQISSQEADAVENEAVRREIQARLTFGDTEIKLIALDVATGNYVRATLDFLNK